MNALCYDPNTGRVFLAMINEGRIVAATDSIMVIDKGLNMPQALAMILEVHPDLLFGQAHSNEDEAPEEPEWHRDVNWWKEGGEDE